MRLPTTGGLARAWDAQGASQRIGWLAAALALAVVAALALIAAPLSDAIGRARSDVARDRVVLEIARARIAESATLARAAVAPRTETLRAAIDRVMSKEGLKFAPVEAASAAAPVRIVLAEARFDALVRALDTLAREDGVRMVEATITSRVEPGSVRAELALAR